MSRTTSFCALLIAACSTVSWPARADEAADTAAARALGDEGLTLADAGDCQHAVDKLKRADELHHAPTTAGRLGECEIEVGRIVAGTERIQRLLREPLGPNPPAAFVDALTRARRALDRALPRIATIRVSASTPSGTKVEVAIDGERLPEALLDNDRPIDPGHHTIVGSARGYFTKTQELTLSDAESVRLSIDLAPDPAAQAAARQAEVAQQQRGVPPAPAPSVPLSPPPNARAGGGANAGAIVAFILGGVGLAGGVAGGLIVSQDASDLSKACGATKICPQEKESEISSAKTWATVSTVGFAVAGAGLGTGLILLLVGNHQESSSRSEAKIRPVVGPLYLGCEGAL